MKVYETNHLVTMSDLNHHNSLLAPVQASWHMIAAFNAAAMEQGTTLGIVARNINQMSYTAPGRGGDVMLMRSRVVAVSEFQITVNTKMVPFGRENGRNVSESYITFTTIEEGTSTKRAHGVILDEPADEEEANERIIAERLLQNKL